MKLSRAKVTYPGRKQVFRHQDKKGDFIKDILGLESEKIKGAKLLQKVVDRGRIIYKKPTLAETRDFAKHNLSRFPVKLKDISGQHTYPVEISPGLKKLRRDLSYKLEKRQ